MSFSRNLYRSRCFTDLLEISIISRDGGVGRIRPSRRVDHQLDRGGQLGTSRGDGLAFVKECITSGNPLSKPMPAGNLSSLDNNARSEINLYTVCFYKSSQISTPIHIFKPRFLLFIYVDSWHILYRFLKVCNFYASKRFPIVSRAMESEFVRILKSLNKMTPYG